MYLNPAIRWGGIKSPNIDKAYIYKPIIYTVAIH